MARFRPHRMYPGALLAQEACSYQAMTELLSGMRGDLVVLIHSDRDCANVLPKTRGRIYAHHPQKFLCTNLTEDELVTGQGNVKLRESIEAIHEAWHPNLLIVLSTCPTIMIGDSIAQVTRKAARELGIRAVARLTHGLKPKSPAEVVDDLYTTLIEKADEAKGDVSRAINLVGISLHDEERAEIKQTLEAMGLRLNVVLNERAVVEDFLRAGQAAFNILPGPNLLLSFKQRCERSLGLRSIEVPLPYGVQATDAFWRAIAQGAGIDEGRAIEATRNERETAQSAVLAFRQTHLHRPETPPKLAYNIGSVRSFDLRRIAFEELGELPLMQELGLKCELFIQGPQHEANWDRTAKVLRELGVELPFKLFPDPGGLVHFIQQGEFALFYGARFLRDQLTQINLPLLHHHALRLGYDAVPENIAQIAETIGAEFYRPFRAQITSRGDSERLHEMLDKGKGRGSAQRVAPPAERDKKDRGEA